MRLLSPIQESVRLFKTWHIVVYFLLCAGFWGVLFFPDINAIPVFSILAGAVGALLALAMVFYDVRIGYYGMIAFSFILSFLDRFFHSSIPLFTILFLMPMLLFISVLVSSSIHKEKLLVSWHPVVLAFLGITVYGLLQIFNPEANSIPGWISFLRQEIAFLLLLLVSFYVLRDLKSIRFFFKFLFGAIIITALYGIYQEFFGLASWDAQWLVENPDVAQLLSLYGLGVRKFSFLSDPANFGVISAGSGVALLILALELQGKKLKAILFVLGMITLWGMTYSGTRTGNIMVAGGLALYVMMTIYKKRTWIFMGISGLAILFILYAPIYGNLTLYRIRTSLQVSSGQDASFNLREMNRQFIKPYIHSHPFGGGVNTVAGAGTKYNPDHYLAGFPPDSQWLAIALEQGWVGLGLNLLFVFLLIYYGVHYFFRCRDVEIKAYYAVVVNMLFTIGLLAGYTQFTLTNIPQFFIYIPFIVIIAKLKDLDSSNKIIQRN